MSGQFNPNTFVTVGPVSQATTASLAAVAGTLIDSSQSRNGNITYTVQETGGINDISAAIQGSFDQATWYSANGEGAQSVPAGGSTGFIGGIFAGVPFFRYYQMAIEDDAEATGQICFTRSRVTHCSTSGICGLTV